jgi:predicted nuclease of predicted toxin-antitoxin system
MALSPALASWLSELGYESIHASDLSMAQAPDSEILRIAALQSRIVITADLDFPRLLALMGSGGPGLILLRGGNYSEPESRECVRRVLASLDHTALAESIVVIDKRRIRRRRLPLSPQ